MCCGIKDNIVIFATDDASSLGTGGVITSMD